MSRRVQRRGLKTPSNANTVKFPSSYKNYKQRQQERWSRMAGPVTITKKT